MRSVFSFLLQCAAAAFALCIAPYFSIRTWAVVVDPDIWWHIRTGDWIAAHHAVPHYAIFSQHIEHSWVAYSWLFDLMVSAVNHRVGLTGILGFLICLQVLISLTFLLAIRHLGRGLWLSWLIAVPVIYASYVNPLRSVLFSLLFFSIEMLLIFETERKGDDKLLFWTAPLFFLWANLHLQFSYGMFVLALYVGTRIVSMAARRWLPSLPRETSPARLVAILAAAFAGSCLGPNWAHPYAVLFYYVRHNAMYQVIQEMMAMSFRRPEHYVELVLLASACYVLGRSRRQDLFRPALLLVSALVSFRSLRDAWFVSIAAGFVLAEAVGHEYSPTTGKRPEVGRIRVALNYALAAAVALCVSFSLASIQGANAQGLMAVIDRVYPIGATGFVSDSRLPGPMYNSFNWGGFLIFNLREQPVSIDSRANAYGDDLVVRSLDTFNAIRWQDDPDLSRANFVLLERVAPLASALESDPRYRLAYRDHVAVVFVREQGR